MKMETKQISNSNPFANFKEPENKTALDKKVTSSLILLNHERASLFKFFAFWIPRHQKYHPCYTNHHPLWT